MSLIQLCWALSALIISAVASPGPGCGVTDFHDYIRIVGGASTTIQKYPWTASLRYNGRHVCGASIMDSKWILTAAHCFFDLTDPPTPLQPGHFTVVVGSTYQDRPASLIDNVFQVEHIVTHALYKETEQYDVALVKLSREMDLSGPMKRSVCLPSLGENFVGQYCVATGWGRIEEASPYSHPPLQSQLREVTLPIVHSSICSYYMGDVHASMICAGDPAGGIDACQGDSGGPLACQGSDGRWVQIGIVSYGLGCARENVLGVYTDVSKMRGWLEMQMTRFP